MEKEIAKILLDVGAVSLRPNQPFTFTSGIKSPIYCDNRLLISYPKKRNVIIEAFLSILKEKEFDTLAGTATAGIPWCSWLAQKLHKPMIYVRGKAKEHGKENLIEGKLEKGRKVIIVEDLVSTGGSSIDAVGAVREAGGIVEDCIAIFTYQLEKAINKFNEARCNLITLTNFSTLVEVAVENEYIKQEEKLIVFSWNKDPENWANKYEFQ